MIPTFRPTIRRADMDAVLTRLAEDSIGAGSLSREFSQTVAKYVGKRNGVSIRSYGRALTAVFNALGLPLGSRVGLSVLAPVAVYRVLQRIGLVPVPIDTQKRLPVLPSPLDFDYQSLELAAIFVDSRLGYVADIEHLGQLRIPMVEDISEGLGGNTGNVKVGSVGEMTIVGLEAEHIVTAGGGATIITNNTRRIAAITNEVSHTFGEPPLPDMNAALGITQMKQLERFIERRKEIASRFERTVQRGRYTVPLQAGDGENVFLCFPVLVDSSPREVEKYARSHGVDVVRAFSDTVLTVLREPTDSDTDKQETDGVDESNVTPTIGRSFPNALSLASRIVLFPSFPTLTGADQEQIERVLATMP